jgi:hypothetical protein
MQQKRYVLLVTILLSFVAVSGAGSFLWIICESAGVALGCLPPQDGEVGCISKSCGPGSYLEEASRTG